MIYTKTKEIPWCPKLRISNNQRNGVNIMKIYLIQEEIDGEIQQPLIITNRKQANKTYAQMVNENATTKPSHDLNIINEFHQFHQEGYSIRLWIIDFKLDAIAKPILEAFEAAKDIKKHSYILEIYAASMKKTLRLTGHIK